MTRAQSVLIVFLTLAIILLFFLPATLLLNSARNDVADLAVHEGKVLEIEETEITHENNHRMIITLKLEGLNQVLGLYYLTHETEKLFLDKIHRGDLVKVHFLKYGKQIKEGINLHVWQLEWNGQLLISNIDSQNRQYTFAKMMFALGLVFLSCPYWLYRYVKKKNREKQVS